MDFKAQEFPHDPIHVAIDLETAGTDSHSAVVQIGCWCVINGEPQAFMDRISLASCESIGMVIDKETMEWWNGQDPELRNYVFGGTRNIKDVVEEWVDWINKISHHNSMRVVLWGNGATFDNVIWKNAVHRITGWPIGYRNDNDLRTILRLTPVDVQAKAHMEYMQYIDPNHAKKHDALSDARYQYAMLRAALVHHGAEV